MGFESVSAHPPEPPDSVGNIPQAKLSDPEATAVHVRQCLDAARLVGGHGHLHHASETLRPWIGRDDPPASIRILIGRYHSHCHQFDRALREFDSVLALEGPPNADALAGKAAILVATGRYEEARRTALRLSLTGRGLEAAVFQAEIAGLTGNLDAGIGLLQEALGSIARDDTGRRTWIEGILADMMARRGDTVQAEAHFRAALAAAPNETFLLARYADFLIDGDRRKEAAALLQPHAKKDDSLLLRYLIATAPADPAPHPPAQPLAKRLKNERKSHPHLRDEALLALHLNADPATALQLAAENWKVHREPADACVFLVSALAARKPEVASAVLAWLRETRLQDVRLTGLMDKFGPALPAMAALEVEPSGEIRFPREWRRLAEDLRESLMPILAANAKEDAIAQLELRRDETLLILAKQLGSKQAGPLVMEVFDQSIPLFRAVSDFPDPARVQLWNRRELTRFLRAGGQLDGLQFDPAANIFMRRAQLDSTARNPSAPPTPLSPIYLDPGADLLPQAKAAVARLSRAQWESRALHAGQCLHECAEAMLLRDWSLRGKGTRWFVEGAANVAAAQTLERVAGKEASVVFLNSCQSGSEDSITEAELEAWQFQEAGRNKDGAARQALYAGATARVLQLAQEMGPSALAQIRSHLGSKQLNAAPELADAIAALKQSQTDPVDQKRPGNVNR